MKDKFKFYLPNDQREYVATKQPDNTRYVVSWQTATGDITKVDYDDDGLARGLVRWDATIEDCDEIVDGLAEVYNFEHDISVAVSRGFRVLIDKFGYAVTTTQGVTYVTKTKEELRKLLQLLYQLEEYLE